MARCQSCVEKRLTHLLRAEREKTRMLENALRDKELESRFWSAYGHLEGEVAPMDYDDTRGSESFTDEEIARLIALGLVKEPAGA